jgi:hypothetical protein
VGGAMRSFSRWFSSGGLGQVRRYDLWIFGYVFLNIYVFKKNQHIATHQHINLKNLPRGSERSGGTHIRRSGWEHIATHGHIF